MFNKNSNEVEYISLMRFWNDGNQKADIFEQDNI